MDVHQVTISTAKVIESWILFHAQTNKRQDG